MDRPVQRAAKRLTDLVVSASVLIVTAPLLAVVALVNFVEGRQVIYRQRRVGLECREFELLKFRSMRVNDVPVEEMGQVDEGHPMVTPLGRLLRRYKIDELPQLINVLKGDMSLVGPRPTVPEQVELYDAFERRRQLVKPGVTGWAQVNGGTRFTWSERIALDVWYVDHWTLWLDVGILVKTGSVVVWGERPNQGMLRAALAHGEALGRTPS